MSYRTNGKLVEIQEIQMELILSFIPFRQTLPCAALGKSKRPLAMGDIALPDKFLARAPPPSIDSGSNVLSA
jgi:hypothetical protein